MNESRFCRSCGHDESVLFFTGKVGDKDLPYYLCSRCGLIFHDTPIPPDYYREQYRQAAEIGVRE